MNVIFPAAFEDSMKLQLKGEFEKFRLAHEAEGPVSIRVNPAKAPLPSSHNIPWTVFGKYLDKRPIFTLDPLLHAGAYYVQEASSMFVEQLLKQSVDLTQPLRVLDLCAAPGGKSTHLLSLLSNESLLVSNEVIRSRASVLSENIQKWGHTNVVVTNNDPKDFEKLQGYFDVILVDAPCSGEGLFRKDPDAMAEWSPENVALCSQRQQRILKDIWPALKQNGVLIYCTCTYNPEENENNLAWLQQQKNCEAIEITPDKNWGIEKVKKDHITGYHFYPHTAKGEGFFISAVRKTDVEAMSRIRSKPLFNFVARKTTERLSEWVHDAGSFDFILQDDLILMIAATHRTEIEYLIKELNIVTKGVAIASLKHDKLIPEHAFALMNGIKKDNFEKLDLGLEDALTYLRKDVLNVSDDRKGFALVAFEGFSLGWVNLLGNRMNNLYPANWRIRMGSSSGPHSTT